MLFCVVPNFHVSPDVAGVSDEEMQKKIMSLKKANSFSSYCKNLVGLKDKRNTNKSVDSEVRNIARMCFLPPFEITNKQVNMLQCIQQFPALVTDRRELESLLFFALFTNNYYYLKVHFKEKYEQNKLHK